MKIAQVAPLFESVPPRQYGGTERVVSYLTEALVEAGHDVTLFASGDSVTTADLVAICERSLRTDPNRPDWTAWHMVMVDEVFRRAAEFDVIHFHIDALHYPLARRCTTACLTTLHGRLDLPALRPLHRHFAGHPLVSISNHQRTPLPEATFIGTVHHGLPPGLFDFNPGPQDYFAFLGRISPEKRLDRAIEIALACGMPLKVAAKVDDVDRDYFTRTIEPLLAHPLVEYLGEVDDARKQTLLGRGPRAAVPDRLARAVRPGADRGAGLRHAGRRLRARLGARADRRRGDRLHRPRPGAGDSRRAADPRDRSRALPAGLRAALHRRPGWRSATSRIYEQLSAGVRRAARPPAAPARQPAAGLTLASDAAAERRHTEAER